MTLDRMISIMSTSVGFFGSIFLVKGLLKLTPDVISQQSQTKWGYNKIILENICDQKADFICGVSLIFLAFLLQISNLIFVHNSLKIFSSFGVGIGIACSLSFILAIMFFTRTSLVRKFRDESQRCLAKQRLEKTYKSNVMSSPQYKGVLDDAERICNINKEKEESPTDFLKRYSSFLGVNIPADTDFSKLHKKEKNE